MNSRTSLLLVALALAGCIDAVDDASSTFSMAMTSADAAKVLALVNDPATTQATLDVDAGLDARAAAGVVGGRPFADLAQLDAVKYVGDVALQKLLDYANAHPTAGGEVVEGVTFASWEAQAVVWGVNHATVTELDVDADMDARAAKNLVASAPYASVTAMGPVSYVGGTALAKLKARAGVWYAQMQGPQPCTLTLATRADANAEDFSRLLAIATTMDYPNSAMTALQIPPCAVSDPALPELLRTTPLIDDGYDDSVHPTATTAAGATNYVNWVQASRDVVNERIADGMWAPANADEQALLDRMPALVAALTDDEKAHPDHYTEVVLRIEANECSSWGSAVIEKATGRIWVLWKFPGC